MFPTAVLTSCLCVCLSVVGVGGWAVAFAWEPCCFSSNEEVSVGFLVMIFQMNLQVHIISY